MDTSDYPSLPNLTQTHVRLAANSRRVEEIVDSHLQGIEQVLRASVAGDWQTVAETSHYLAGLDPEEVGVDVVKHARQVCQELSHQGSTTKPPKHLSHLLQACSSARNKKGVTRFGKSP